MSDQILDVDLLAFERTTGPQRRAVVDGVRRSLETGFVYTSHDLSEDLLDTTYAMLRTFFELTAEDKQRFVAPGANGQTGYTGLLVETAASSDKPDWKEMLNWSKPIAPGHPLKRKFSTAYPDQVLPEAPCPASPRCSTASTSRSPTCSAASCASSPRASAATRRSSTTWSPTDPTLTRAIRYPAMSELGEEGHVWAAEHGDINLITALPRATAPGLQVKVDDDWVDATPPADAVIINTGIMLERLTNGVIPIGWHRVVAAPGYEGERYSVVQFCHPRPWTILSPVPSCCTAENPQRFAAISAEDALDEVLYEINLVETARRVG